jgi:hypothetical protein
MPWHRRRRSWHSASVEVKPRCPGAPGANGQSPTIFGSRPLVSASSAPAGANPEGWSYTAYHSFDIAGGYLPQFPLPTSSTTTHVTSRGSPSMETIATVNLRIISRFCTSEKTPPMSLTWTSGMGNCPRQAGKRPDEFRPNRSVVSSGRSPAFRVNPPTRSGVGSRPSALSVPRGPGGPWRLLARHGSRVRSRREGRSRRTAGPPGSGPLTVAPFGGLSPGTGRCRRGLR